MFMDAPEKELVHATSKDLEQATKLGQFRKEIEGLEGAIKADMEARFEMEERGLKFGKKIPRISNKQRGRDRLTQQNSTSAGFIVWLQFPNGESCSSIKPLPIFPLDPAGLGGEKEFEQQAIAGATEIRDCAEKILEKVRSNPPSLCLSLSLSVSLSL